MRILLGWSCTFLALLHFLGGSATAQNAEVVVAAARSGIGTPEFERLLSKLPTIVTTDREGNEHRYYVVEGDILMSITQVFNWAAERSAEAPKLPTSSNELIVLEHDGEKIYWPRGNRNLTYRIDRSSFKSQEDYSDVAKNFAQAARDWEEICPNCGISFREVGESDDALFKVQFTDQPVRFLASSFYPNDPTEKRTLLVSSRYFSAPVSRTGVLRHEIGHILGYRHTHIAGVPGCDQEDKHWLPLTPDDGRDSVSVMHYLCGDGGTLEMQISETDGEGHRKLYGPG